SLIGKRKRVQLRPYQEEDNISKRDRKTDHNAVPSPHEDKQEKSADAAIVAREVVANTFSEEESEFKSTDAVDEERESSSESSNTDEQVSDRNPHKQSSDHSRLAEINAN